MLIRNAPNQKLPLFLQDSSGNPVTGEASNITAYLSLDGGSPETITSVTEIGGGFYYIEPTQAQTNGHLIVWWGTHSTYKCYGGAGFTEYLTASGIGSVLDDTENTTTSFKTSLSGTVSKFLGMFIKFDEGTTCAGEVREIVDFNSGTGFVTVNNSFSAVPQDGDQFVLMGYSGRVASS